LELVNAFNEKNKQRMDIEGLIKLDEVDKEVVRNVSFYSRT